MCKAQFEIRSELRKIEAIDRAYIDDCKKLWDGKFASYISIDDFAVFAAVARKTLLCLSIRETGADSVRRLEEGAAPKPHRLLDKSIKNIKALKWLSGGREYNRDSLMIYDSEIPIEPAEMDQLYSACRCIKVPRELTGLVGHTCHECGVKTGKEAFKLRNINGLFVTSAYKGRYAGITEREDMVMEYKDESSKKGGSDNRDGLNRYIVINGDNIEDICDMASEHPEYFYTGDYDLHDILYFLNSGSYPVLEDDIDAVVDGLNKCIRRYRKGTPGELSQDLQWNRIQHGPQNKYLSHMIMKEPKGKVDEPVLMPSLPVLFFHRDKLDIVTTVKQLNDVYESCGVKLLSRWKE